MNVKSNQRINAENLTLKEYKEEKSKMEKEARIAIQEATDLMVSTDLVTFPFNKKKTEIRSNFYNQKGEYLFSRYLATNMPSGFSGSKSLEILSEKSKREKITLPSGRLIILDVVQLSPMSKI